VSLDEVLLATVWVSVALYAVLGGADFGAGVWEAVTRLRAPPAERRLIASAVTPVWEANHVWLVFVFVLLANAFPPAFAGLCRGLAVPLAIALAGIVMRGSAFVYRAYGASDARPQHRWGVAFAVSSALAPICFGLCAGALASGAIRIRPDGSIEPDDGEALAGWMGWTPLVCAALAPAACAYLAAVYLAREAATSTPTLAARWRRRAIAAGVVAGALALGGLLAAALDAPELFRGLRTRGLPMVLASGTAAVLSFGALARRRYTLAALGAAAAVGSVVLGWGLAQFPVVVPPDLTLEQARAPDGVLRAVFVSVVVGAAFVVPSIVLLLVLFKRASRG
jgi:cytochrome d ubiquinol oxidase subunit II